MLEVRLLDTIADPEDVRMEVRLVKRIRPQIGLADPKTWADQTRSDEQLVREWCNTRKLDARVVGAASRERLHASSVPTWALQKVTAVLEAKDCGSRHEVDISDMAVRTGLRKGLVRQCLAILERRPLP